MAIGIVVGKISTLIVLIVVFYLLLTPISFVAKIVGERVIDLTIEKDRQSYWMVKENKVLDKSDYEKQY